MIISVFAKCKNGYFVFLKINLFFSENIDDNRPYTLRWLARNQRDGLLVQRKLTRVRLFKLLGVFDRILIVDYFTAPVRVRKQVYRALQKHAVGSRRRQNLVCGKAAQELALAVKPRPLQLGKNRNGEYVGKRGDVKQFTLPVGYKPRRNKPFQLVLYPRRVLYGKIAKL